jgi:hypothetical protein
MDCAALGGLASAVSQAELDTQGLAEFGEKGRGQLPHSPADPLHSHRADLFARRTPSPSQTTSSERQWCHPRASFTT